MCWGLEGVELLSQVQMTLAVSNRKKTCHIFRIKKSRRNREAAIDPLFREAINLYEIGTLVSENKLLDAVSFCGKRKTRSHH